MAACGDDGPCLQDDKGECIAGETGAGTDPGFEGCAPHDQFEVGAELTCQGEGTGWLVTDVYGAGKQNPLTSCLAYEDPLNIPEFPTPDDCASVPLYQIPLGIPTPTACCTDDAAEESVVGTCELDCGFAACNAAIAAIRASADALVAPEPILEGAYDISKADLYAYADMLEAPLYLARCAEQVAENPDEIVELGLGGGASSPTKFGHIKDATLHLSCALDPEEPYASDPSAGACEEPTNIPASMAEQEAGGSIAAGAVTVSGPSAQITAAIHNASVSTRETLNRDMSVDFTLTAFEADVVDTSAGSFEFRNTHISLGGPASGTLEGEAVTFAPGTLRFVVNASVLVDGEALYGGLPAIAEFGNDTHATAIRGLDGSFHFVDATFVVGEYTAVLNTEPSVLAPVQ
ncbi:hypothetical protein [Enhygromyxa salina]|nr:hypothetical protein [Enhygromyxa salina]